jgi:hypothetical protein
MNGSSLEWTRNQYPPHCHALNLEEDTVEFQVATIK